MWFTTVSYTHLFQVGDDKNLNIIIDGYKVDKFEIALISPFGEISPTISYAPNFSLYAGKFNLENVTYRDVYKRQV